MIATFLHSADGTALSWWIAESYEMRNCLRTTKRLHREKVVLGGGGWWSVAVDRETHATDPIAIETSKQSSETSPSAVWWRHKRQAKFCSSPATYACTHMYMHVYIYMYMYMYLTWRIACSNVHRLQWSSQSSGVYHLSSSHVFSVQTTCPKTSGDQSDPYARPRHETRLDILRVRRPCSALCSHSVIFLEGFGLSWMFLPNLSPAKGTITEHIPVHTIYTCICKPSCDWKIDWWSTCT